jgi:hypothetical protein
MNNYDEDKLGDIIKGCAVLILIIGSFVTVCAVLLVAMR